MKDWYTLPPKEHPHYGEVIKDNRGRLVCHICGKAFVKLGQHVSAKHQIFARDYKLMYGLNASTGLLTERLRKELRKSALNNPEKIEKLTKAGKKYRFRTGHKRNVGTTATPQAKRSMRLRNYSKEGLEAVINRGRTVGKSGLGSKARWSSKRNKND